MMEKSCPPTSTSTSSASTSNQTDHHHHYLKQLNKTSHKISKPIIRRTPPSLDHLHHHLQQQQHEQQQQQPQQEQLQQNQNPHHPQQQQNQPPVYNINKSDFRQVVQKLTGSPAHDRFSTPPPPPPPILHSPKPQSSRLQRIRPPPLAHLTTRPPPPPPHPPFQSTTNYPFRSISPLSPLPPFPTVHAAAESPISAYMKYLRGTVPTLDSDSKSRGMNFPPLSPQWFNPPQQGVLSSPNSSAMGSSQFMLPNSPLAFGRIPSPKLPYPLLSPNLLFSPTSAQFGFPQFNH